MKVNLFILSFFFLCGCAGAKHTQKVVSQSDSLSESVHWMVRPLTVPRSEAALQIPAAGWMELPSDASFTRKSGQATATVRFQQDTLFVWATCDSLQALVYEYEQTIQSIQSNRSLSKDDKEWSLNQLVAGFLAGIILACVIHKICWPNV